MHLRGGGRHLGDDARASVRVGKKLWMLVGRLSTRRNLPRQQSVIPKSCALSLFLSLSGIPQPSSATPRRATCAGRELKELSVHSFQVMSPPYPHENARGAYINSRCSLCVVTFFAFGAILGEISPAARLEHPMLVQRFTAPHVDRPLFHS